MYEIIAWYNFTVKQEYFIENIQNNSYESGYFLFENATDGKWNYNSLKNKVHF